MSEIDESSRLGFDAVDHQPAYIYTPCEDSPKRPSKRRKLAKSPATSQEVSNPAPLYFSPLLNDLESAKCTSLRHELFERSWGITAASIQDILGDANEDTLSEVTKFVVETSRSRDNSVPTGFVITGPNIASQDLLFKRLSTRLRAEINGLVMTLRSADSTNLKGALKQLIRDATSQRSAEDTEDAVWFMDDGRKLLNYDLEILHGFVNTNGSQAVVVIFQDSEAFDSMLLADLISLFSSWKDRIPFVLLFGVATSVGLFQERLPRSASRCLRGIEFEVEQTNSLLDRIFEKAVAGTRAPLRLSPALISNLMERQEDHVQSIQSFIATLRYAYMCHYYFDALSIFNSHSGVPDSSSPLQKEHLEAIRMLPSFRKMIEDALNSGAREKVDWIRALMDNDEALQNAITSSLSLREVVIHRCLRAMHLFATCSSEPISKIDLYLMIFEGGLGESYTHDLLDAIKRMSPQDLIHFLDKIKNAVVQGAPELDLPGWADEEANFISDLADIRLKVSELAARSTEAGKPLRSSYAIHNKGVRTTVIAQRVQLSYEKSVLTEEDKVFTSLVDRLSSMLEECFTIENPENIFLNELWTSDHLKRYREIFIPRPRAAIERALTAPYDYLECDCCESVEGLSSTHPATAILYQMYLETGSLINIFDLWSAFFEMVGNQDDLKLDERDALVMFYRALADLKSLGLVKQSKKKADHLAKVAWNGL